MIGRELVCNLIGEAKEQHSFHFYDSAPLGQKDDEPARDLIVHKLSRDMIARAMQWHFDPNSVEMQGWFTNALKAYGPCALQLANSLVNGGHKRVAKQDDKLISDLIAHAMQYQDRDSDVMAAIESLPEEAQSQFLFSVGIPALAGLLGSAFRKG